MSSVSSSCPSVTAQMRRKAPRTFFSACLPPRLPARDRGAEEKVQVAKCRACPTSGVPQGWRLDTHPHHSPPVLTGGLTALGAQMANLHHSSLCAHTQAMSCGSRSLSPSWARLGASGPPGGLTHRALPWAGPAKSAQLASAENVPGAEQNHRQHALPLAGQKSWGGGGDCPVRAGPAPTAGANSQHPSLPKQHPVILHIGRLKSALAGVFTPWQMETPQVRGRPPPATGLHSQLPPHVTGGVSE